MGLSQITHKKSYYGQPLKFFKLLGKERHLNWIEHETIRKKFNEPRIHFALNCASVGCPALRQKTYRAESLDSQLEEQTKIFLRDASYNKIDLHKKKILLLAVTCGTQSLMTDDWPFTTSITTPPPR